MINDIAFTSDRRSLPSLIRWLSRFVCQPSEPNDVRTELLDDPISGIDETIDQNPRATANVVRLKPVTDRLLQQITPAGEERRREGRTPFCMPVMLGLDEEGRHFMPGYIRDISPSGMGFKHGTPLGLGDVTAQFCLPDGTKVTLRVNIRWSRRLDANWFISGGEFIDVA